MAYSTIITEGGLLPADILDAIAAEELTGQRPEDFGLERGLEMKTMLDVLNVSSGRNSATDDKFLRQVLPGTFKAGFATRLMAKDVRLFREGARAANAPSEVAELVADIWTRCEQAMPGSDFTEIFKFVREGKR